MCAGKTSDAAMGEGKKLQAGLLLFSLLASAASAAPSGSIVGVYHLRGRADACELLSIDVVTGANTSTATDACAGNTATWPSFSVLAPGPSLILSVASASHLVSVDARTGAVKRLSPQANNDSDPVIGLVRFESGVAGTFLLTRYAVWDVTHSSPTLFAHLDTSALAEPIVTSAPGGGTGGSGRIFVGDQKGAVILVVDMGAPSTTPTRLKGISGGGMDICYDGARDAILQMTSYTLYTRPSKGGGSPRKITSLPDGPGFPSVHGMAGEDTWWFMDFASLYFVPLPSGGPISTPLPFVAAPRISGFPHYIASAATVEQTDPLRRGIVRAPKHRVLASGACDLTGTYTDRNGNVAALQQHPDGTLNATSLSDSGWTTARGAVSPPSGAWMLFDANNLTAVVSVGCTKLAWSNGAVWTQTQPNTAVERVHVVFMTHLDVGFTLLARDVCDQYFDSHFPRGIALSQELRALGGPAQYAVTTHPWLVQEYFDAATNCSHTTRNASAAALMEDAIARGDVRWHGKPMNNFAELEDGPWFDMSLTMSRRLNERFNTSWGVLAAKSTDVPGFSKSAIPRFAAAGIRMLHMGYNSACRTPELPSAFMWLHEETGTDLLALINDNYGSIISPPGSPDALAFLYSVDNTGPPSSAAAVSSFWASTQRAFPNAELKLSSLDAFAAALLPISAKLPSFSGEIGQSWSYGAPADPLKLATYRSARRARNAAVGSGDLDAEDPDLLAFERRSLVGGPEHNWGLSFGGYVPGARSNGGNWSNELFEAVRYTPPYELFASSNTEKRDFCQPLAPPPTASAAYLRLLDAIAATAPATPSFPDLSLYTRVGDPASQSFECGRFSVVRFSPTDGSIASLVDARTGREWGGAGHPFAAFHYRTYTEAEFDVFNREYNPGCGPPCGDFAKNGMDSAGPENRTWMPSLTGLYVRTAQPCSFVSVLAMDPETVTKYGGMQSLWLTVDVDTDPTSASPQVQVGVQWLQKTATRLAESTWLSFAPNVGEDVSRWTMDILGAPVSPLEVVDMGTRHLHAVWDGVEYDARDAGGALVRIHTRDAPLVAPGDANHLLWYDGLSQPDLSGGWHFVLESNLWGTAFPQWQDCDMAYAFTIELQA